MIVCACEPNVNALQSLPAHCVPGAFFSHQSAEQTSSPPHIQQQPSIFQAAAFSSLRDSLSLRLDTVYFYLLSSSQINKEKVRICPVRRKSIKKTGVVRRRKCEITNHSIRVQSGYKWKKRRGDKDGAHTEESSLKSDRENQFSFIDQARPLCHFYIACQWW